MRVPAFVPLMINPPSTIEAIRAGQEAVRRGIEESLPAAHAAPLAAITRQTSQLSQSLSQKSARASATVHQIRRAPVSEASAPVAPIRQARHHVDIHA